MKNAIEYNYGLKVNSIEIFGSGQTSEIFKIVSDSGTYVLKSQLNEQTASNEFYCLEALSKIDLSAVPLRTINNKIFIEYNSIVYILMTYVNTQEALPSDMDCLALGKTIKSMHSALSNLKLINIPDRFNEEKLIETIKSFRMKQLVEKVHSDNNNYISDCLTNIHGDLGVWNLLLDDKKINIIDFGEAGYGDPFFDLAAVTESLNLKDNEIKNLLHGYGRNDYESMLHLSYMQKKWRLRGIIYLAANNLKTEAEIYDLIKLELT